jgi:hypothetical protein
MEPSDPIACLPAQNVWLPPARAAAEPRGTAVGQEGASIRRYCCQVHGEQYTRFRQFPHANHRSSRTMVAHLLNVGGVQRPEVAHLVEKDVDVDDVSEVRSDRLQHHLKAVEDLTCLRSNIRPGQLARRRIDASSTAIAIKLPTFAIWLYGPIGSGVFGGVLVSTAGMAQTPPSDFVSGSEHSGVGVQRRLTAQMRVEHARPRRDPL